MKETIRFKVRNDDARQIDEWIKQGLYNNREEFVIEALKKRMQELQKKR